MAENLTADLTDETAGTATVDDDVLADDVLTELPRGAGHAVAAARRHPLPPR